MSCRLRVVMAWLWLILVALPTSAQAWWNADWSFRKQIRLDAAEVPALGGSLNQVLVPVRLHAGNFPFLDATVTGADLRFVAADDKTPLNFHVEQFEPNEEIAIVWVQVPTIGAKDSTIWLYYGNPDAPAASSSKSSFDPHTVAAFHFGEREGLPRDATGYGNAVAQGGGALRAVGALGFGLGLRPGDGLRLAASPALATPAGTGWTVALWVRPADPAATGVLLSREEGARRLVFGLDAGKPYLRLQEGKTISEVRAEQAVAGATWVHLAFTLADRAQLYVDGRPAGEGRLRLPEMRGDVVIGAAAGLRGLAAEIDELQISNLARAPEWFRAAALSQHPQSALVQYGGDESGGGMDYLAVIRLLAGAVSRDGWIIIGIIGIIGLVTAEVALVKLRVVGRAARQNGDFLAEFRDPASALARLAPDAAAAHGNEWKDAPLLKLYEAATDGLAAMRRHGIVGALTSEALEVIRANVDTSLVTESQRLNNRLVLLTLAVSAAPFLGLLGTVVGIMITFGAIAMAGDVNVNTIAPGVAAAITTTVAGLIVAIPAMFTYNVLATRIKVITTGMEIFANELISRIALEASRPAQAGSQPTVPRVVEPLVAA